MTANSKHPKQARAFLDFLYTRQAQKNFADSGYRPVVGGTVPAETFPTPSGLFTVADLGGWSSVSKKFFDPDTGIMAAVERRLGVATKK